MFLFLIKDPSRSFLVSSSSHVLSWPAYFTIWVFVDDQYGICDGASGLSISLTHVFSYFMSVISYCCFSCLFIMVFIELNLNQRLLADFFSPLCYNYSSVLLCPRLHLYPLYLDCFFHHITFNLHMTVT